MIFNKFYLVFRIFSMFFTGFSTFFLGFFANFTCIFSHFFIIFHRFYSIFHIQHFTKIFTFFQQFPYDFLWILCSFNATFFCPAHCLDVFSLVFLWFIYILWAFHLFSSIFCSFFLFFFVIFVGTFSINFIHFY